MTTFLSPENDINAVGYSFLKKGVKKALSFFKLNVENYPESANAFDSLCEAYMILGNTINAIKNYKTVLRLDPNNNNNVKEIIRKLKAK